MSLFKGLRIPPESSISALISAKLSSVLMVFCPQEAPSAGRSGSHNITKDFQTRIRMPQLHLETEKRSKIEATGVSMLKSTTAKLR